MKKRTVLKGWVTNVLTFLISFTLVLCFVIALRMDGLKDITKDLLLLGTFLTNVGITYITCKYSK